MIIALKPSIQMSMSYRSTKSAKISCIFEDLVRFNFAKSANLREPVTKNPLSLAIKILAYSKGKVNYFNARPIKYL